MSETPAATPLTPWEKKRAQDDRRRDLRSRNERLFTAVQEALVSSSITTVPVEKRLANLLAAIAAGGDVNARATLVQHDKARPLGMVALDLPSPHAIEVLNVLLENGADLHIRDRNNNTFTHTLVSRLGGHRATETSLTHLKRWLDLGGAQHLSQKNQDGDTPLSLALREVAYSNHAVMWQRRVVQTLVEAGSKIQDLPPTLLHSLIEHNRSGFDLAVELGVDVQQRTHRTDNLWATWARRFLGRHGNEEASRRAWMERLIELGVDRTAAYRPALDRSVTSLKVPQSALMVTLQASLRMFRVDEVCLTRLLELGGSTTTLESSPLHEYASQAKAGHLATLHRLGFDLAGARNAQGETLLQTACSADLRGISSYEGEVRTIQDTVATLLDAGCDPNALGGKTSKLRSPVWESALNPQATIAGYDRALTVKRLLEAGADLDASSGMANGGSSAVLIGRLLYPHTFSTDSPRFNDPAYRWQSITPHQDQLDTVALLLQHGANVPHTVIPDGMPVLLGIIPTAPQDAPTNDRYNTLWDLVVANEEPDWPTRVAHETLAWLGKGVSHTNVTFEQAVPMLDGIVAHGVPANALGHAARALRFQPEHPLTRYVETLELRAEMRQAMPQGLPALPSRARL